MARELSQTIILRIVAFLVDSISILAIVIAPATGLSYFAVALWNSTWGIGRIWNATMIILALWLLRFWRRERKPLPAPEAEHSS